MYTYTYIYIYMTHGFSRPSRTLEATRNAARPSVTRLRELNEVLELWATAPRVFRKARRYKACYIYICIWIYIDRYIDTCVYI